MPEEESWSISLLIIRLTVQFAIKEENVIYKTSMFSMDSMMEDLGNKKELLRIKILDLLLLLI
jgi:hypothetical protein